MVENVDCDNCVDRKTVAYSNNSNQFLLNERNFQRQYAHIYSSRLWTLRKNLIAAANKKWSTYKVE
jgi:hypothetical protein